MFKLPLFTVASLNNFVVIVPVSQLYVGLIVNSSSRYRLRLVAIQSTSRGQRLLPWLGLYSISIPRAYFIFVQTDHNNILIQPAPSGEWKTESPYGRISHTGLFRTKIALYKYVFFSTSPVLRLKFKPTMPTSTYDRLNNLSSFFKTSEALFMYKVQLCKMY